MSRYKKTYVGKIGYCDNSVLGLTGADGKILKGGHYVYIREINGSKCNVNVITSLEDKKGQIYDKKLHKVKKGYLYPIPISDTNLAQWSAVNLDGNINNVPLSKINNIGYRSMKTRHKFIVGKFTKRGK